MVRRFTTVPAIFSRDIFTITRPETNGDACSGDRLTTGAGREEGRGGRIRRGRARRGAKEIRDERRWRKE